MYLHLKQNNNRSAFEALEARSVVTHVPAASTLVQSH